MNPAERIFNPLLLLQEHGQRYWLDNLTRGKITSGELERRVREEDLRGVTSNPAIFNKAIAGSTAYNEQILEGFRAGLDPGQIYDELTTTDVRNACDLLRSVYDRTEGVDGYLSLEVSPHLARDHAGTITEAHRLWNKVDRPNLYIKIPGTVEGWPAIEECLADGININITLLFSIGHYEAVAEAYQRALERRLDEAQAVNRLSSVASFFLSRIDVLVDKLLEEKIAAGKELKPPPADLLGRAAVANGKLAYQSLQKILDTPRWRALAKAGARPQQIVWASTSTKNPNYHDIRYVEPLIGPYTINTLPDQTVAAFADHGTVADTLTEGLEEAQEVMNALAALGIDFHKVTKQLEHEGIEKFIEPYDAAIQTIAAKRPA